jgi:hypothetical protein
MLSFPLQKVDIRPHRPAIDIPAIVVDGVTLDPGIFIPREPRTASVNMRMIVTVEIAVVRSGAERTITSWAIYEYTGGELSDEVHWLYNHTGNESGPMEFVADGEWRLLRHERAFL